MKKIILILLTIFCFSLNAQYYSMTYVSVASEDVADFEEKEMKYWSQVAKKNIEKGKQLGWALMRKYGTAGNNDVNYAFVNQYSSLEDMTNSNSVWGESVEELGYNFDEISTKYEVWENHIYKVQDFVPGNGKVFILNYGRPENLSGFISENKNLWKPFHQQNITSGATGMVTWGIGTKIYPSGQDMATVMTWDGFTNLADALKVLDFDDYVPPSNSKMRFYDPDGFRLRVIWEQLKQVPAQQ